MKSILVHIHRDDGQNARFKAALDVTRAFDGHLSCLQVTPLETFAPIDPYGVSFMMAQVIERISDEEKTERAAIEARLKDEPISWEWQTHAGAPSRLLAAHSWLADLVVLSATTKGMRPRIDAPQTAADVVIRASAPVLAVPHDANGIDCAGAALIAWDGSAEASTALRHALPLLKKAGSVTLVTVDRDENMDLPASEATAYLARHGITASETDLKREGRAVSQVLLEAARTSGASYIVMGAYGHSRLRESVLGGVTKDMLERTTLPLLLAH